MEAVRAAASTETPFSTVPFGKKMNHHGTLNDILRFLVKKRIAVSHIDDKGENGVHIIFQDATRLIWWRGRNDEEVEITNPAYQKKLKWYFDQDSHSIRRFWYDHETKISLAFTIIGLALSGLGLYYTIWPRNQQPSQALLPTPMSVTPTAGQEARQP